MDNLTHTLIGVAVARSGLAKKYGPGTTSILAVASNLPDIDAVLVLLGRPNAFLYRRMFTHSIVGVPIIALAASWIFSRWAKNLRFRTIFGLVLFGMALHVLFDLMNSYGVVVFYPFSRVRPELAWLFIIDLAIWVILLLPLFIEWLPYFKNSEIHKDRLWKGVVATLALYVGLCGSLHWRSKNLLSQEAERLHLTAADPYVFPEALGFQRFKGVLRDNEAFNVYQIRPLTGQVVPFRKYETVQADPRLKPLLETPRMKNLLWFFKRPIFQWTSAGRVRVYDLRFISTVLAFRNGVFGFEFDVPPALVSWVVSAYTHPT